MMQRHDILCKMQYAEGPFCCPWMILFAQGVFPVILGQIQFQVPRLFVSHTATEMNMH